MPRCLCGWGLFSLKYFCSSIPVPFLPGGHLHGLSKTVSYVSQYKTVKAQ